MSSRLFAKYVDTVACHDGDGDVFRRQNDR